MKPLSKMSAEELVNAAHLSWVGAAEDYVSYADAIDELARRLSECEENKATKLEYTFVLPKEIAEGTEVLLVSVDELKADRRRARNEAYERLGQVFDEWTEDADNAGNVEAGSHFQRAAVYVRALKEEK